MIDLAGVQRLTNLAEGDPELCFTGVAIDPESGEYVAISEGSDIGRYRTPEEAEFKTRAFYECCTFFRDRHSTRH